jgi:hypothetical protein
MYEQKIRSLDCKTATNGWLHGLKTGTEANDHALLCLADANCITALHCTLLRAILIPKDKNDTQTYVFRKKHVFLSGF